MRQRQDFVDTVPSAPMALDSLPWPTVNPHDAGMRAQRVYMQACALAGTVPQASDLDRIYWKAYRAAVGLVRP